MPVVVLAHVVAAVLLWIVGARIGSRAAAVVAFAPLAGSFAWLLTARPGAEPAEFSWRWIDALDLELVLRLDGLGWLLGLLVTGVGALVVVYAASYLHDDPGVPRFLGTLVAFAGAMAGLVVADDLFTLFLFWELTSVTSFLLIGHGDRDGAARTAATRALLVTGAGGLVLLGGLVALALTADTTRISALASAAPAGAVATGAAVAVLIGALTKSAQVPFHFWLPGAMQAPTPVSAYLHSATMVKAGVILLVRFAPVLATLGPWRWLVVGAGVASLLLGGVRALTEHDAKLALAHGTVSQLGLLAVLAGLGVASLTYAAVAMLVAHALFKAPLFLVVGIVDHATGTRDLRRLGGLRHELPVVAVIAGLAAASMAALPPLAGFVAKEKALDALLGDGPGAVGVVALVGVVAGSVLTVAYTTRWWWTLFAGPRRPELHVHAPGPALVVPAAVLAVAGVAMGVAAGPVGELVADATGVDAALYLWPGVHPALGLSALAVTVGIGVAWVVRRRPLAPAPGWVPRGEVVYQRSYDGLLAGARRVAALVQPGSLPAYLTVVFVTVVAVAVGAIVAGAGPGPLAVRWAAGPAELVIGLCVASLAVFVPRMRRRFTAAVVLGGVGYGLALLFLLQGAPDLALTQFLVETLSLVALLLVLRHLPDRFDPDPSWAPQAARLAVAAATGSAVALLLWFAGTSRTGPSPVEEYLAASLPDGGGRNVVNVILVDFRGADTLGEITVLGIAAIGVSNLVRAARRAQRRTERGTDTATGWTSVIVDLTARLLFPVVLLVSVYVAFRGHNAPGGGFAGGLVAGSAFAIRYLAEGRTFTRGRPRVAPTALIGGGLTVAALTAVVPMLVGNDYFTSTIHTLDVPVIGKVKLVSAALFDLGVYALVIGVVLLVLSELGSESQRLVPRRIGRPR
jgi:multicomponent Na+:H+ antiporter subunit A